MTPLSISLRVNIVLFALLAGFWLPNTTVAQTIWTGGTGDWFNNANWSGGVPTSSSNAQINNGGTAQVTANGAQAGTLYLGFGVTDSGTLSASGAGTLDATFYVGENGSGTLSITKGGTVTGTRFIIGDNSGSTGVATVSGAGSTWTNNVVCFAGFSGTATLNIMSGGQVSDSAASIAESTGSVGIATVDGVGSTWTQFNDITVGGNGTGTLNITNGGTVSEIDTSSGVAEIGRNPGSSGTVTVDGTGSSLSAAQIAVGENGGTGLLRIENGGKVNATTTTLSSLGTLEFGTNAMMTGTLRFFGGTLRPIANATFAKNMELDTGGAILDSNGLTSTLTKVLSGTGGLVINGTGTTTLSAANTYSGGTTLNSGTLLIKNTTGSGTGTGAVQVNAGTVGGTGTIAGSLTVGTGSGAGSTLSPSASIGTLTIQSALSLKSDATYKFELNSSTALADKIVANGVTINGAKFSFTDLGSSQLAAGTTFVVIDNTSTSAISGVFTNLPDNSQFTDNGNTYLVSYEGGSGNDLTLRVVTEPWTWQLIAFGAIMLFAVRPFSSAQTRGKIPLSASPR